MASSSTTFNKEVVRFTFKLKQELLQEILENVKEDSVSTYREYIVQELEVVNKELNNFEKVYKAMNSKKQTKDKTNYTPRPMSSYNKFIKKTLPEIAKDYPDMNNKSRMAKASEIWKKLSDKEKVAFKDMVF
jgi:flagellar biosynthesis chaperone FliJ